MNSTAYSVDRVAGRDESLAKGKSGGSAALRPGGPALNVSPARKGWEVDIQGWGAPEARHPPHPRTPRLSRSNDPDPIALCPATFS
jgi:hypothetical protein